MYEAHAAIGQRTPEMHAAARVGTDGHERVAAFDRPVEGRQLAITDRSGQLGFERRERTPGTTAETVVVELDQFCEPTDDRAYRGVRLLDVTEMARILDDHRSVATTQVVKEFGAGIQ